MIVRFFVPGKPVPKGRPRVTKWGTYTPKSTVEYERRIKNAWLDLKALPFPPNTPLFINVHVHFEIPKSESKKKRAALNGQPHTKRGDLDNVVKCVLDALNEMAFPDDSAVVAIFADKYWDENPRTEITIGEWKVTYVE